MDGLEYLEEHYQIQNGMYFSGHVNKPEFVLYSSRMIKDSCWNYGCIKSYNHIGESVQLIENYLRRMNRKPCVYLLEGQKVPDRVAYEYGKVFEDAWLGYAGEAITEIPAGVILAQSEAEENDFIQIFRCGFCPNSEGDANSADEYCDCLREAFTGDWYFHFVCYDKGIPVAVATLGKHGDWGAVYNLACLAEFRAHGLGTKVLQACIARFYRLGGKRLFLQTKAGGEAESWYLKRGFRKLFNGVGYVKI